ncbi:two-component system histidine kinase PnpS [Desulfospira joergensenii]|uniref:two-component system histidine kinase PnpS n=1 Tax=Desulfospira joergensenii TaxID=53329 RepID=UPI0003B3EBA6|nr:HAMP domain-containing histidine kinase [Desulfospira joergensenii]
MYTKKKLIWQIFPSFLIIILVSLFVETWYSTNHFKTFFLENSEKELTVRAKLIQSKFAHFLIQENLPKEDIDRLCKELGADIETRLTVISPSGVVLGDSQGRVETMENHSGRPEIREALKGKKGMSMRYSSTLDNNMMYIALPILQNGKPKAVVRTAVSVSTIDKNIKDVRNKILFAMLITVMAAAAASLYVARRIIRPVEEMKKGAQEFAKGNLTGRLAAPDTEELSELARVMNTMARNLDERIEDSMNRQRELEAVHTSMQEGVIAIDNDERIITINAAASKIFDFPASQLKKRNILEVARNFELQTFIQKALATHEPVEDDILVQQEKDHILNIHSTALYDTQEKRMGTLIIFHDITRIRRLESMHKAFAANVSHELKTPLTTIKGFIETLQEMLKKDEETQSFLKILEKNVNRMIELINDLLALARLERLQGTGIEFEEHHLSALINGVVNICRTGADKKNIAMEYACPEDLTAMVDPILMEQALINLVDNAVKYSPEKTNVHIEAKGREDMVEIRVRDTGTGMDKEHLPKIFNRFYRVDKARSRHEGGTGLGLAIVKHIVQYHNGRIEVQSKKGMGTTFTISLPA